MNEMVKIQHQQWARDLDDQRRSGLTQREWCRIHGISIHTFEDRCRIVRQTMENLLSERFFTFSSGILIKEQTCTGQQQLDYEPRRACN